MKIQKTLTPVAQQMALAGLLAMALPAFAQTAPAAAAPAASEPAAEAPSDRNQLQQVVVTATRRSERLQDVPLAVTAATAKQIEGAAVNTIQDVSKVVSGVTYGESPNDSGFRVRGVGSMGGFSSASELPVGVVIDGVVMGLGPVLESMTDVERLEALKGPQGTQFGKNASSGVVSITTRRPKIGKVEGDVSASYGSLNEHLVQGTLNVPINDSFAARVSVFDRAYDGFVDNITRDEKWGGMHAYGARAKLLFKATPDLDMLFSVDATQINRDGPSQLWTLRQPPVGFTVADGITPGNDNDKSAENARSFENTGAGGGAIEVNYRLGDFTLSSVTAHRARNQQCRFGLDQTADAIFEGACSKVYNQDSQELRLTSPKGQFEYVAGFYFSKLEVDLKDSAWLNVAPGTYLDLTNGINATNTVSRSYALFSDGRYRLGDQFSLLAGVRMTRDTVSAINHVETGHQLGELGNPPGFLIPATGRDDQRGASAANKPSGRLGFEWKPEKDVLVYATAARGYLGPTTTFSGTYGTRSDVKPQSVDDLTVGFKTQFLDRKITLNGSVFHDRYKNLQVGVFNGVEFLTENAGSMTSRGIELDASARVTATLTVRGSVTYADATFDDYVTACPTTGDASRCYTLPGSTTSLYQAAGEPLMGAPKVTGTFGLDYSVGVLDDYFLDTSISASFRGKTSYGAGETAYVQSGYSVANLAFKFAPEDDSWNLGLWSRNLFDRRYQSAVIGLPFAAPGGTVNWATRDGRRSVGVSAGWKF